MLRTRVPFHRTFASPDMCISHSNCIMSVYQQPTNALPLSIYIYSLAKATARNNTALLQQITTGHMEQATNRTTKVNERVELYICSS